jgi:hypothetical protein
MGTTGGATHLISTAEEDVLSAHSLQASVACGYKGSGESQGALRSLAKGSSCTNAPIWQDELLIRIYS